MRKSFKASLLALALFGAAGVSTAATDSAQFQVLLTVTAACTISSTAPTNVDFSTQARTTGLVNIAATGTLTVNCNSGVPYEVGLNDGLHYSAARRMARTDNAYYVPYELYKEVAHTNVWGNTGLLQVSGTGTGANQTLTVYGHLTSLDFPAGNYADTITATITY